MYPINQASGVLTLAHALQMPQADVDDLGISEITVTQNERAAAGRVWLALLGLRDDAGPLARAAWADVAEDAPLVVALHRSPAEFLAWWRAAEWDTFPRTEREGWDDSWAWGVLDRARRAFESTGVFAGQVSMASLLLCT